MISTFFFNGIWRMDWGLGNPNTTAALIATLMVAAWGLSFFRHWGFWVALILFTLLGGCLVHTFSRGGLVAVCLGLLPLLVFASRPWPVKRLVAVAAAFWLMIGFAIYLNAHERYGQGVVKQDLSISNRLHLWKHGPLMISDAPQGWGLGNAAKSYMRWYQPFEDSESYRTFVNSHLEWLIEVGWPLRFLYLFGWAAVFVLCLPSREKRWLAMPFGIWVAFGVAAIFSSVAESPWLWILPGIALLSAVVWRGMKRQWPRPVWWTVPIGAASVGCLALLIAGGGGTAIEGSKNRVVLGSGQPDLWLVVDEKVLGGVRFGKSLRLAVKKSEASETVGVVWSTKELPSELSRTVVVLTGSSAKSAGAESQSLLSSAKRLVFLSPTCHPQEVALDLHRHSVAAIFGEFSQTPFLAAWEEALQVQRVEGSGDFVATWPDLIISEATSK